MSSVPESPPQRTRKRSNQPTGRRRTLASLDRDEGAIIARLEGPRIFRRRLLELGLVPGTPVMIVNVAPLGDPIELEVRGCRLSIRLSEAEQILVEPAKRVLKVVP